VAGCSAAGSPWLHLRRDLLALLCPRLTVALYKAPFPPLDRHLGGICPPFCLGSFRGEGSCSLVGGVRSWQASLPSFASVDLVGARPLSAIQPLEDSCLHRPALALLAVESPAGCWRSWPFSWSRSSLLDAVETPGMPAGRQRCPWHTPEVIPMTLAPKTGEVSWACMGLRRVLSSPKSCSFPSKSQDPSSGLEVTDLEVRSRGVSSAVSGHAGSNTDPAGDRRAAASRCAAPWNLCRFRSWPHAATSAMLQGPVLSFGPFGLCNDSGGHHVARRGLCQ
jgi:hypothetical protein